MPLFGPPNVDKLYAKRDVKKLIKALGYKDASVRTSAVRALGDLDDVQAIEALSAALLDDDKRVRGWSADALGKIGDVRAVEPLLVLLRGKDEDGWVRLRAADALGKIGDGQAVRPLMNALNDVDYKVREGAASALVKIGSPAVEPLCAALKGDDHAGSFGALVALGNIGDVRAVEPLLMVLKDEDQDAWVRLRAAEALGKIGDARAVGPLRAALNDEDEEVRGAAASALETLGVRPEAAQSPKVEHRGHETEGRRSKRGPVAQSEFIIELFNRERIDPAGSKILAFAMLYERGIAPAVWVGPGPDPFAAEGEGAEARHARFLASKIVPQYQPHLIPGHLAIDLGTSAADRQFRHGESLEVAYFNQVLAVMLAELLAGQDLSNCSALSLSGESSALGQTRFAIVVGGASEVKKQPASMDEPDIAPTPAVSGKVISESVTINRSRQDVWNIITTPETWKRWYQADDLIQVIPGWQEGGILNFASGQKPTIKDCRPPTLLQWGGGTYIRLSAVGASLTEVEYGHVGEGDMADDPALWREFKRLYAPAMVEILNRLKRLMER